MLGVVLGLLAIAAAVYLTRRCLTQHRNTPPDPGFEVDTALSPNEVEPFMATVAPPMERRDTKTLLRGARLRILPSSLGGGGASMRKLHRSTMDELTRQPVHARPFNFGPVVHEEDAEDVELAQILPPMYREAWAERRPTELRDRTTGV